MTYAFNIHAVKYTLTDSLTLYHNIVIIVFILSVVAHVSVGAFAGGDGVSPSLLQTRFPFVSYVLRYGILKISRDTNI